MAKLVKGDFIKIDYSARLAANNQLFDTTSMEKAKEGNIFDEHFNYSPMLVVVGKGHVLKGLDEELEKMEVGGERKVEVPPEKGFGARDPALVKIMPASEFKKRDIDPFPGMVVDLDGDRAVVKSVSGGRVMVDLNHALAGEKLVYELKVVEKLEGADSKIKALLEKYDIAGEPKVEGELLEVNVPKEVKKDLSFLVNKSTFINSVLQLVGDVKRVRFVEDYDAETMKGQEEQEAQA